RDLRWDVEDESNVGEEAADGNAFERQDQLEVDVAECTLIDPGGIDEAITDDPASGRERRLDRGGNVIVAGGRKQHRLGFGAERLGCAGEEHVADDFGAWRAARLAGLEDIDVERA